VKEYVLSRIPLVEISVESLQQDMQNSRKLVEVQGYTRLTAFMLDYDALEPLERRLIDDGDLPPSWAYWWLTLAAELSYNAPWGICPALIVHAEKPSTQSLLGNWLAWEKAPYQVIPLMVEDICGVLTANSFSGEFVVTWGVNGHDFNKHPALPLSCRGAIFPIVDGMGALCIATDEDRSLLQAWIRHEVSQ
jgi:hypothetical protein